MAPDKRLDVIISTSSQEKVVKNRAILTSIIKCVEFCGRNGIALRGHRDDSTSTDISQGKFKELVNFVLILVMKFFNRILNRAQTETHTCKKLHRISRSSAWETSFVIALKLK